MGNWHPRGLHQDVTDWELVSIAEFKKISVFYEVGQSGSSLLKWVPVMKLLSKESFMRRGAVQVVTYTLALALAGRVWSTVVTESPEVGYPT